MLYMLVFILCECKTMMYMCTVFMNAYFCIFNYLSYITLYVYMKTRELSAMYTYTCIYDYLCFNADKNKYINKYIIKIIYCGTEI